ncbi:MAG: hypothetical protein CVU42_11155 [Chloroflexi bacterium HGW-Chloroflexi-4]|jgi:hypothetical protein|nr:MAG: hypothetical protein CVU42_11155 [Chloroflexi bacterium HGW-Chloroflexi-4]
MKRFSIKYAFKTYKLDQLWLPLAIFLLFVLISLFQMDTPQLMNIARSYLAAVVPLLAGILAAYSILEDPALELRFATPIPAIRTLIERLGLIFIIQSAFALFFQAVIKIIGGDFSMYQSVWRLQLAWIIPTLSLMMLGCSCSLLAANSTIGALMVGMVWLVELIARGWFAQNFGKYFLVFMGPLMPDHPDLFANHVTLFAISSTLFLVSMALLEQQERYI